MTRIVEHLERYLGPIQEGWKADSSTVRAVRFVDQPHPGVDSFVTLGLSNSPLPMQRGRQVRQECMVSVYRRYPKSDVASFLTTFADYVCRKKQALLRGDVIGPASPLIPGVKATGVYASLPVFFPEVFATYRGSDPATVIVWLVPLMPGEIPFIKTAGWERFERELERRQELDFWSLDREELALGKLTR